MTISTFDDLLRAAAAQTTPQRLLFVFATAGVPDDATPDQRARFEAGQGGTLAPLMCVAKLPAELASFDTLRAEARQMGAAWDIVFVAAERADIVSIAQGTDGVKRVDNQLEVAAN